MPNWAILKLDPEAVSLRGEQVAVTCTFALDGEVWAGREVLLPLDRVDACKTDDELRALVIELGAPNIRQEGTREVALKKRFVAAFGADVAVPAEAAAAEATEAAGVL